MKSFLALAALLVVHTTALKVTPVQKVIQLLTNMAEKGKKEKHEEQVQFAAYKQFCDDTSGEKDRAIKEADQKIEVVTADIQKHEADAARLTKEVAQHQEDIAVWDGDKKAATKVRTVERADYEATHKDYSESIDALQRAIAVLKKQNFDRKQAESLVQLSALKSLSLVPTQTKRAIDAFIAQSSGPAANAYEFQSTDIIDMLAKLLDKFTEERTALEKAEANTKHAYEMLMQDLKGSTEQATAEVTSKTEGKASHLEAAATAKGDLADTTATRDDDKKYLTDLTATCSQKAADFESRQKLRADEIAAIEKAIEIISGDAVSGSAAKHLPSMVQTKGTSSLSQLRADMHVQLQQQAVQYLRLSARKIGSRVLAALATKVSSSADPFKKVKQMIEDLITRLMQEANEEATHKGWCDEELATNKQTRDEKTSAVEKLHADIDSLTASIAKLGEEITEASAAVAEIDAAVKKATEIRQTEKETNTATVDDAKKAQVAVAEAIAVLKDFYAKAGEATAFVQRQPAPAIFDSPYKGMQSENGGVVGMLEVIESDFARLEAETTAAEAQAQKSFDDFMTDSAVTKTQHVKDIEHKTTSRTNKESALEESKGDLEGTQKELDAALAYFDKLKPSCVDAGVSYDDRVARRQEEIESLQEALKILNGEDLA